MTDPMAQTLTDVDRPDGTDVEKVDGTVARRADGTGHGLVESRRLRIRD